MNQKQNTALTQTLRGQSAVIVARVGNGIDQTLTGNWSTARLKSCDAWQLLTDEQKQILSRFVDMWLFEADGNKGADTEKGIRAYYKPESNNSSVIMPSKFVV